MRRWLRRSLVGVIAVPVAGAVLMGVEVQIARSGQDLPETEPFHLDGRVGSGSGSPLALVWLGDSTAAGVGASSTDFALPRLVATAVSARLNRPVDLKSLAVSGDRVGDVLRGQVGEVPAGTDLVVIDIGSNDVTHLTSRADFRARYKAVLDRLPNGVAVVMLGVPDIGAPPRLPQPLRFLTGVRGGTLDAVVQQLARERGHSYVDIAGRTGPEFRRSPGRLFAADGYHPSDAGYRLWAKATVPVVTKAAPP